MKKIILLKCLIAFGISLTSCSVDENGPVALSLQADLETLTKNARSGSWRITSFIDSGSDDTDNFNGFKFFFESDGSLFAKNGTNDFLGSWSITMAGSDNGFSANDDCANCTTAQLTDILTTCSNWYIDKLERNDEDLEENFSEFLFNFYADGSINAENASNAYSGSWESSGNGNNISVIFTLTGVSEIEEIWTLHEIELENGESKVDLRNSNDDRLRFENSCTLFDYGNASNSGNNIDFNIFFASPANFNELSEDWDVVSHSPSKIDLIHISGGDGSTDLLTFEKN